MESKTAILIQTHNNAKYIITLANHNKHITFFVHVDLKFDDVFNAIKKENIKNIILIEERISVYWGGVSQIYATLKLLDISLKLSDASYFHLMSGECFPLLSLSEIEEEWDLTPDINFIESRKRSDNEWRVKTWLPHADSKHMRTFLGKVLKKVLRIISSYVSTTNITDDIYYGSQWFSINRKLSSKILAAYYNEHYFDDFKNITCSDEHALQMLVRKFKFVALADNNRRFIHFYDGASSPLYLDTTTILCANKNVTPKYWFARKMHETDMLTLLTNKK